ncbi:MAG: hypothetical protein R2849_19025 [Thermomicrobiales bacterium]
MTPLMIRCFVAFVDCGPGTAFAVLATRRFLLIIAALSLLRGQAAEPATTPFSNTLAAPTGQYPTASSSGPGCGDRKPSPTAWMRTTRSFGGERLVQYFDKSRMDHRTRTATRTATCYQWPAGRRVDHCRMQVE